MAQLGAPQTSKFILGATEVRIAAMSSAGRMTSKHSVGVIDGWGYELNPTYAELKSGFPRALIDKAVIELAGSMSFTTREYTSRNLNALMGNAVVDYPTAGGDLVGTVVTSGGLAADLITIVLTADITFVPGQTVAIYSTTDNTNVTISTVATYTSGTKTIVLTAGMGLAKGFADGEVVKCSLCATFGGGSITGVNYFSVQLVYVDRAFNRPVVVDFWKCSVGSGIKVENKGQEFSAQDWTVNFLVPTVADYATSAPLYAMRSVIPSTPMFRVSGPLDIL